jgi:hypothetical protein
MVIPDWLEMARTAVFWAATIAMVGYVVWSYLRDHPEMLEAIRKLRLITALRALLSQARGRVESAIDSIRRLASQPVDGRSPRSGLRIPRLRGRSPRQRVIYYYVSILQRASRMGFARRPYQTPIEYEEVLGSHLDEAQPDMAALTEAFLVARYSVHDVSRGADREAKEWWRVVRRALVQVRARRRRGEIDSA